MTTDPKPLPGPRFVLNGTVIAESDFEIVDLQEIENFEEIDAAEFRVTGYTIELQNVEWFGADATLIRVDTEYEGDGIVTTDIEFVKREATDSEISEADAREHLKNIFKETDGGPDETN